ncbi:MAG: protein translocase subunit SecF [Candidatus Zixiibacteriota bacterium]|nr:MAG: protein translocase subunit SecF [candidate division Zixibacteria bacterium]
MEWFKNANYDFLKIRRIAMAISAAVILAGLISLVFRGGPNYSIDFRGGISVQLRFQNPVTEGEVRSAVSGIGLGDAEIKRISELGGESDILIQFKKTAVSGDRVEEIKAAVTQAIPGNPFDVRQVETIGPKIGSELRGKAILASLIALAGILIYVSVRFEFLFSLAAVLALFHDVLVTLGIFSILGKEISLTIVAALLTIIGYSINDTIVIFDRIRENLKRMRTKRLEEIINTSINQTLSRTIVTNLTVFLVLWILFIFGGTVIRDFSLALLIGSFAGTYSTVYIASPVLVEWNARAERLQKRKKK